MPRANKQTLTPEVGFSPIVPGTKTPDGSARIPRSQYTAGELRAILIASDPRHYGQSQRNQARLARLSLNHFREVLARPHVMQVIEQVARASMTAHLPRLMDAALDNAINERGREGHYDRRMLFSMAGMYNDRRQVTHKHEGVVEHTHRLGSALSRREELEQSHGGAITLDQRADSVDVPGPPPAIDAEFSEPDASPPDDDEIDLSAPFDG
jgi:hypothetical protein